MAIRLIIEVEGDTFRLRRKDPVDTVLPAAATDETSGGLVAELRDEHEGLLFRQNLSSQLQPALEVFSRERIQRIDAPGLKKTLVLLLPDETRARSLVFVRTVPERGEAAQKTSRSPEEVGRISLVDGKAE